MSESPRVLLWALPSQVAIINDAVRAANLVLVGAGSPTPEGSADLARWMGVERFDDLRLAIQRDDFDLLWLAAPQPVDIDARRLIQERNVPAISSEPQFASMTDLVAESSIRWPIVPAPQMMLSPGYRAAADVLSQFGEPSCINIFFRSGEGQGTLFARLFDAMSVVNSICGPIEHVDAGMAGPLPSVPEELAGLHGHMTINVRFKQNCCACVALSDCAGTWFRGVTVLGAGGCLRISDGGFEWVRLDGQLVDSHEESTTLTPGELIGRQIARFLDVQAVGGSDGAAQPPQDLVHLLALCEAARLSCLTGQDESPTKLVEMLSRP